ncbi:MAG TPA: 16S rRNA (adenine(1518)-N(6)/adenine(1519)-N(6))-dimethyltransferase RsmA [Candidatus Ratteibacteria bacterium]|jgi:16S rRNA (adenine1518-N6/adenine1519-N6)-dimethyltransferase|uniref:Ribosomal RNA small subunit methyltransferase A n=1 Tax=candidate division TA06 bacterium ADurb.Bin131 TaxID=1852827 RepID=A0A1V6C958_UNCT6|nr:MAG: Ribosomal RNA small subunit methyltransferase A [candidate division TA06 bacterium ADurb.Bin131]HON04920.1 16S rRNA (adenine(1518)-N(6)/adenine(1519)-N(6))-dimethyltransferase RsmA [bacterium]HRS05679.1 16S rRNA (adenine(1518)-N(6)/adenine(1519)-N(6))-dimethyltransferase RsmA [Candidatus Ratteibacteria bacterium]HOQ81502.1 16S rRNA (adenine(1518)-N(6)/adenine(1519)-N(6))-dimethyltransferase RsmA [bacterium]HPC29022.1 16S rRNA (adenine(1518)-N(6)/adenine(1519)-N(6))-dimethyltransferase R
MDTFLTLNKLQTLLRRNNINPRKNLGQSFLIDKNIRNKILSFIEINKDDTIVEIGSGTGALTGILGEKAGIVYAFEKDEKLADILQKEVANYPEIKIIKKDFLDVDGSFFKQIKKRVKIVGNLPYYAVSPILFKLFDIRQYWNTALVMVPEEVATRIIAKTGDKNFGIMAFLFSLLTKCSICYKIKGSAFYPEPEITSVVMKISMLDKPSIEIKNQEDFWRTVPKLFVQKRKTVLNVLRNSFHMSRETAESILRDTGIKQELRTHQIEIPTLIKLIEAISQIDLLDLQKKNNKIYRNGEIYGKKN